MRTRLLATIVLFCLPLLSQEYRGTFSGTITDPQQAPVAGAKVTATETQTGTKTEAVSESTGAYNLPFLAPGTYQIKVEAPGFKQFTRTGLTLSASEHPVIDIAMQVGDVSQSVTVAAESPLLIASNASVGQTVTTQEVEDLPVNGRTPIELATLAMGVINTIQPGPVRPFDNPGANFQMGGAPAGSNELLLDGAPDAGPSTNGTLAYSPPHEAVQEVRVNVFDTDAAYGHTNGGTVNQILKSGGNTIHGAAYEFNQQSSLDANQFYTNKAGQPTPPYHQNQYGISAGGPVLIPKVYNGKNKLFWFFAYEGLRDSDPANSPLETGNPLNFATVPTAAERTGDFSALLALNTGSTNYTIYNPFTGVTSGTAVARTPFPNNVIPSSLINPIAKNLLSYFPMPNLPGLANGQNNYAVNVTDSDVYDNELGRLDYNLRDNDKLTFNARHSDRNQQKNNYFGNVSQGTYLYRVNQGTSLDEVHIFSPSLVMDVRANWTRWIQQTASPGDGFDPTSLGFPSYIKANSEALNFPYIAFSSCSVSAGSEASYQCLGTHSDAVNTYDTYQLFTSLVKVQGNQTIKFGGDFRDYRQSAYTAGNSASTFTFNSSFTNGPLSTAAASPLGQDLAALLLGLPSSGSMDLNSRSTSGEQYYGLYLQDDWRLKPNLTLNIGVRFEYETPITERYNRAINGFNGMAANPVSSAAAAAYAAAYATGAYSKTSIVPLTPSQFTGLGALTYPTTIDRNVYNTRTHLFSPRLGFAWTPGWGGGKTVIRGGFGMFEDPIGINGGNALNQQGFSQTTQYVATSNNYLTPANTLSNPFPSGILGQGAAVGPGAFLGQAITFFNPNPLNPYSVRWDFAIQRQLPGQFVLEVAYIGNHSVHLPINQQLDYIPRQYLSTLNVRDTATINALTGTVPNPYKGLLPNSSSLNGSTVALDQLLVPFPQYPLGTGTSNGVIEQGASGGSSYYESLNVRLQKRYSNGLTLINNFTWDSLIGRLAYLNDSDPAPVKAVTADSRPLQEVMSAVYALPFGHGQHFDPHSKIWDLLIGGWSVNGVMTFASGAPLAFGNLLYNGQPLNFNPHQPNGLAFNTAAFATGSSLQPADNIRTLDTMFNNLRADGVKNLDASILKNFNIGERKYLQLRFESFNTTNRVAFAAPNLTATSAAFGTISAQSNTPRRIQIGARLVW
jgi:hypothetical protein